MQMPCSCREKDLVLNVWHMDSCLSYWLMWLWQANFSFLEIKRAKSGWVQQMVAVWKVWTLGPAKSLSAPKTHQAIKALIDMDWELWLNKAWRWRYEIATRETEVTGLYSSQTKKLSALVSWGLSLMNWQRMCGSDKLLQIFYEHTWLSCNKGRSETAEGQMIEQ